MESEQKQLTIREMLEGVERYNPDNSPILEDYVKEQCAENTYDLDANLAILKFYQFNPLLTNVDIINNVLAKALTALPDADFTLCLYLLNESMLADESVQKLNDLHQLMQQCKYKEFWEGLSSCRPLVDAVSNFDRSVRLFIARTVQIAYQTISVKQLEETLNLQGIDEVSKFLDVLGWKIDQSKVEKDGGIVTVPISKDNSAKPTVIQESIKFEQLTKIIGYSNSL